MRFRRTPIWIFTQWVTEWEADSYQAGCSTVSGSRGTGYSSWRSHEVSAKGAESRIKVSRPVQSGAPCYTLYHGPRRDKDPEWVPAIVTKVHGSRSVYVRVCPIGPVWHRHIEQLRPRYGVKEDLDLWTGLRFDGALRELRFRNTQGTRWFLSGRTKASNRSGSQIQVDTVVGNQQIQGYQWGVSMDLTMLEDPSDLKPHLH